MVKYISFEETAVPHKTIRRIIRFTTIYILIFVFGSMIMSFFNLDIVSAMTATAATLGNVGPGLGLVGAAETYTFLPSLAKMILAFFMLLGRLEIFTIMVLFTPDFWKR